MKQSLSRLHIAFNCSIASSIRQVIKALDMKDDVIGLSDDLSFGPINTSKYYERLRWMEDTTGFEWLDIIRDTEAFWREAEARAASSVIWINLYNSSEYCGFLEFIERTGGAGSKLLDTTGIEFRTQTNHSYIPRSLGIVTPEQMLKARLLERTRPLGADEAKHFRHLWTVLKAENAPLRIVTSEGLVSAPIDYFDTWLTRHVTDQWAKARRVVGEALADIFSSEEGHRVSDLWLWGRVRALSDNGVLEISGDASEMRNAMVRRLSGVARETPGQPAL